MTSSAYYLDVEELSQTSSNQILDTTTYLLNHLSLLTPLSLQAPYSVPQPPPPQGPSLPKATALIHHQDPAQLWRDRTLESRLPLSALPSQVNPQNSSFTEKYSGSSGPGAQRLKLPWELCLHQNYQDKHEGVCGTCPGGGQVCHF